MSRKKIRFVVSIVVFVVFLSFQLYQQYFPSKKVLSVSESVKQSSENQYQVTKVIDGDTLSVLINNKTEKVRVIGINTPETVDPRRKVECFGREASDHAKSLLSGQMVRLEADPTQDNVDKYGRLLRYVFLPNNADYGMEMIRQGYAYEYTYQLPYKYQKEYKNAQREAANAKEGLWSDTSCSGKL